MTHDEWVKWADQIENSLVRAESSRKDVDLIVMLRLALKIAVERVKETAPKKGEEDGK